MRFQQKKLTNLIYLGNIIAKRISERKKEIKTDRQRERERERETDRQREREEKTSGSPDSFNVINVTALLLFSYFKIPLSILKVDMQH